jgi:3-mercaptopyruvate sulfurtransferase SseA
MSRFGGGYSSIAAQWVFDSAGLRQIRALDGNRAKRAAATEPIRRSEVAGNEQNAAGNFSSRRS